MSEPDIELLIGADIDELGAMELLIEDAAEEAAEEAADVAAGVEVDPQAARARATPAPATRVRTRLINMECSLGENRPVAGTEAGPSPPDAAGRMTATAGEMRMGMGLRP
jgi:hypothetical protein